MLMERRKLVQPCENVGPLDYVLIDESGKSLSENAGELQWDVFATPRVPVSKALVEGYSPPRLCRLS